jgi:hypothetical protein
MPENSVIVGMSVLPNNMKQIDEQIKLELFSGPAQIDYIFGNIPEPTTNQREYTLDFMTMGLIFGLIITAGITAAILIKKKQSKSSQVYVAELSKKQSEQESFDTYTIYSQYDFNKITKEATELQQLGYDTYMIYVNTSLDVALERNAMRPRSIPTPIVTKSWNDVQQNLGKFSGLFRQNLVVVDNNNAGDDVFNAVSKQIRGLVSKKVKNGLALQWIRNELDKKRRK